MSQYLLELTLEAKKGEAKNGIIATGGPDLFVNTLKQALITVPEGVESIEELDCTDEEFTNAYKKTYTNKKGEECYGINSDTSWEMKGDIGTNLAKRCMDMSMTNTINCFSSPIRAKVLMDMLITILSMLVFSMVIMPQRLGTRFIIALV